MPKASTVSLDSIADQVLSVDLTLIPIDITRFTSSDDPLVLQWRNPSIKDIYIAINSARELQSENVDWPVELATDVSFIAACHVSPTPTKLSVAHFYCKLAQNPMLWTYLVTHMMKLFPHLKGGQATPEEIQQHMADLTFQTISKHPLQAGDLPSDVLPQMQKHVDRKTPAL